ncbi:hypothetical protein SUGI_0185530 [Cryptomeria japonica]|nr:hypothetical protein SUGI_0185530 [Cryptomeria japonica]
MSGRCFCFTVHQSLRSFKVAAWRITSFSLCCSDPSLVRFFAVKTFMDQKTLHGLQQSRKYSHWSGESDGDGASGIRSHDLICCEVSLFKLRIDDLVSDQILVL